MIVHIWSLSVDDNTAKHWPHIQPALTSVSFFKTSLYQINLHRHWVFFFFFQSGWPQQYPSLTGLPPNAEPVWVVWLSLIRLFCLSVHLSVIWLPIITWSVLRGIMLTWKESAALSWKVTALVPALQLTENRLTHWLQLEREVFKVHWAAAASYCLNQRCV